MASTLSALKQLRFLLTTDEKKQWVKMLFFAVVSSMLELGTALFIVAFARAISQPQTALDYIHKVGIKQNLSHTHILLYMSFMVGIVYLLKNIFVIFESFYQNSAIQKMQHRCENSLLNRYTTMDYSVYLTKNSSHGISSLRDVEEIFSRGVVCLVQVLSESLIFICLIGMIVLMNPSLAFFIFISGILLYFVLVKTIFPRFYYWGKILQTKDYLCQKSLLQFFHSFKEIVLLDKQKIFAKTYSELSNEKTKMQAIIRTMNSIPRNVIETFFMGIFVFAVSYLCLQNQTSQVMLGALASYLYVGFRLMPGINRIITQFSVFKTSIPHIDRVYKEYLTEETYQSPKDINHFQFNSHIQMNDVSFKYNQSDKLILTDINLTIRKGECLGIIGETGSGKSTLVDIILGLLTPLKGTVLIDDKFNVGLRQWHGMIGYVPQIIYLIDDTIAANIAYCEDSSGVDKEKLNQAIDDAQLRTFVDSLPLGVETIVGDRGIRLSGGERQRIALARALYRQPTVFIFDEATSALDYPTEEKLMETLHAVRKTHTVIMIAHRLTTLKDCDRIIVIQNGKIAKVTHYAELSEHFRQEEKQMETV